MKARPCTCGVRPSNEYSGMGSSRAVRDTRRLLRAPPAQRHRHRRGRWVRDGWRGRLHAGVQVRGHVLVELVADHLADLDLRAAVHGFAPDEGLGRLGAPPRELLAALTPTVTGELGEPVVHDAVLTVLVVGLDVAQRHLPADL